MRKFARTLFLIIPIFFALSCGEEEGTTSAPSSNSTVPLQITINTPELEDTTNTQTAQLEDFLEFVTTISIVVEGDDFDTISETFARGQQIVVFVLPGDSRTFFVSLLNSEGQPVCSGQTTIDIIPDEPNEVSVDCFVADEVCDDDSDNNGNGLEDCEELDVCTGAQCDGTNENICIDGVCSEPPPPTPDTEENCTDGIDEDEDEGEENGGTDCTDLDCAFDPACAEICDNGMDDPDADGEDNGDCLDDACDGEPCDPNVEGAICIENVCEAPEEIETICNDFDGETPIDNDGDGPANCADSDCDGMVCDLAGSSCVEGECQEIVCDDLAGGEIPIDNDGDESANCNDVDCDGVDCEVGDGEGAECNFDNDSQCEETICFDTFDDGEEEIDIDNDNDGFANCEDLNCVDMPCGIGPAGEGAECIDNGETVDCTESACANNEDDDRDGFSDCDDIDCQFEVCGDGSGGAECRDDFGQSLSTKNPSQVTITQFGFVCTEIVCDDVDNQQNPIDNDDDESANCADFDCDGEIGGPQGEICEPFGEITCDDGFNNDANEGADCDDFNCDGQDCESGPGMGAECNFNESDNPCVEITCDDMLDNDDDGDIDCDDPDCDFAQNCGL